MKTILSRVLRAGAAALALLTAATATAAPRPWLLPSETSFTGSGDEWLTVDAAISTDLYYFDHPAQDWQPVVTGPDGRTVAVENEAKGRLRKTFDVHVTARGTYKVAVVSEAVMGNYLLDGERRMLPRGTTPATLASAVPAGATDVRSAVATTRLETFATAGAPSDTVFKPTGRGLEMVPVSHPTDLVVGEPATFRFLLDGKPAAGLTVSVVNGGVRYADRLQQQLLTTGADGAVTIKWRAAGMWWVSATSGAAQRPAPPAVAGARGAAPAAAPAAAPEAPRGPDAIPQRRDTYAMTVQVLG